MLQTLKLLLFKFILQPSFLAVLHLVGQMQIVRNETDFLFVFVILVTKVTDTTVQVGLLYVKRTSLYICSQSYLLDILRRGLIK